MFSIFTLPAANASRSPSHSESKPFSLLAALLMCGLLLSQPANAQSPGESGTNQFITGAACFIIAPVYGAFKIAYAGLGAIGGGLTWVFTGGDNRAAQKVWDASLKGTYIITPDHLKGRKDIEFIGPTR